MTWANAAWLAGSAVVSTVVCLFVAGGSSEQASASVVNNDQIMNLVLNNSRVELSNVYNTQSEHSAKFEVMERYFLGLFAFLAVLLLVFASCYFKMNKLSTVAENKSHEVRYSRNNDPNKDSVEIV